MKLRKNGWRFFSALFILLLRFMAGAQTLPLTNYTIQNGLPESTVYGIHIDARGYLWSGTQSGVCVFDGKQFHIYDAQSGLPDNHVTAITSTPSGTVWFGHRSGELSYYQQEHIFVLRNKDYRNTAAINCLLWDKKGLWIATAGDGAWLINFRSGTVQVTHFTVVGGLASNTVNQIRVSQSGQVWLATSKGLNLWDPTGHRLLKQTAPLLNDNITAICPEGNSLLLATGRGLFRYTGGSLKPLISDTPAARAGKSANRILKDSRGTIWAGTNSGLVRLRQGIVRVFGKNNGLLSNTVYDLLEDRDHGIWLAQYDGLSCFKDTPFELYNDKDGLVYNETYAVEQENNGNLWVGTAQGISVFTRISDSLKLVRQITTKDGLPDNFIYNIFRDSRNNMWVACVNKGAACYDTRLHRMLAFDAKNGLAGREVCSIAEDKKGRIWLATLDSGMACFDYATKKLTNYTPLNGFPAKGVWTIHRDRDGDLWLGTRKHGLLKLDLSTDQFVAVPGQQRLINHDFGSVSSDSKGNIWIATIGDGVYCYHAGRFKQYGSRNGIKSNNPYFIFCDTKDRIWIGTNVGLDRFDPVTQTTTSYLKNDGFIGIETNQNAVKQLGANELWIGTMNGLMHYRGSNNQYLPPPPPVYITGRQLFFNTGNITANKLQYNQNYITFSYLGLSLSNAEKVRYRYKLSGLRNDWSPSLADNRVSYASLSPGRYTFMVQAGYAGGNWGAPAFYAFEIVPPFYRTWWFLLSMAVIVVLAGAWLYRYRINQLLHVEKMRNKIASDLHDDIGSALSSISIFSEVADRQLQQQTPPERTREILGHISHHSRNMLDAMDDIVWAVNPHNDHFNDLEVRMREFAIPLLEAKDIQLKMHTEAGLQDLRLSMEGRKNVYLIFKECINNILKHAAATLVTVSISKQHNQVTFLISDNGKGFDPAAESNRNGLKNLQKRAAEIHGQVSINAAPGNGSTITLTINII